MDDKEKLFIQEHREDDVRQLALQASRYPDIDMSFALTQIAGWQSIRDKVPTWASCPDIIYPTHVPLEQCSSEATAIYKYGVVANSGLTDSLADLTGGFGIDCWFMSRAFQHVTYVERQEELVKIAKHNFEVLKNNIPCSMLNVSSIDWLKEQASVSWLFLDPARRDGHGGRTVAISDCEPDVGALEETLVQKACKVMVKLSPMLDLDVALHQLKHVEEAHIVSVDNECKELLLVLCKDVATNIEQTPIHCVNIKKEELQEFVFRKAEEQQASCELAKDLGLYLYEPNASIMKAGAYRSLANKYRLQKLQVNSHLYTSDKAINDFPGRRFQVEAVSGFGKKELKTMLAGITKANLTVRNFPATVAELRKRLHIAEGGDTYLFATTLHPQQKILVFCKRL
jgi:16S rRNA G966 N2-methylase RsmD